MRKKKWARGWKWKAERETDPERTSLVLHAAGLLAGGAACWEASQVGSQNKSISYLLNVTHVELDLHLWLGLVAKQEGVIIKFARAEPCREERGDIRMPLWTPFLLFLKTVLSLAFHHLMIYIPSAIFKMTLNGVFVCSKFTLVICMCKQSACVCVCVCLVPRGRAAVEARQRRCLCSLRSTSLPLLQTPHK